MDPWILYVCIKETCPLLLNKVIWKFLFEEKKTCSFALKMSHSTRKCVAFCLLSTFMSCLRSKIHHRTQLTKSRRKNTPVMRRIQLNSGNLVHVASNFIFHSSISSSFTIIKNVIVLVNLWIWNFFFLFVSFSCHSHDNRCLSVSHCGYKYIPWTIFN